MKVQDIGVYITQMNNSIKLGSSYHSYGFRTNKFLKNIISKLQKDNMVDQVIYKKNYCFFRPCNIVHFKKLDRLSFNIKQYNKIYNQFSAPYTQVLITTSKGILNLEEAKNLNLGGILLASYTKKYET